MPLKFHYKGSLCLPLLCSLSLTHTPSLCPSFRSHLSACLSCISLTLSVFPPCTHKKVRIDSQKAPGTKQLGMQVMQSGWGVSLMWSLWGPVLHTLIELYEVCQDTGHKGKLVALHRWRHCLWDHSFQFSVCVCFLCHHICLKPHMLRCKRFLWAVKWTSGGGGHQIPLNPSADVAVDLTISDHDKLSWWPRTTRMAKPEHFSMFSFRAFTNRKLAQHFLLCGLFTKTHTPFLFCFVCFFF